MQMKDLNIVQLYMKWFSCIIISTSSYCKCILKLLELIYGFKGHVFVCVCDEVW